MKSHNQQLKEQISALIDGELSAGETDVLLQAMLSDEATREWETYQQIGDLLRSDNLSIAMSEDFSRRMRQEFATEPTYVPRRSKSALTGILEQRKGAFIALVAATFLMILVPQFAGHEGVEISPPFVSGQFAATDSVPQNGTRGSGNGSIRLAAREGMQHPVDQQNVLRDPSIDSYLAAHQRYSKSMYSTVEYETSSINPEVEK